MKPEYKKTVRNVMIHSIQATAATSLRNYRRTRIAVFLFYFSMGLCFATWASRIPDIKTTLHLGDAALGSILFALPMGQLVTMPFSGRLVTRYGRRRILIIALPLYTIGMTNL